MSDSSTPSSTTSTTATVSRQIGIVKWFDTKKGFGMITTMGDLHKNKDIFAHHTEVSVKTPQYKYLIAGEYVSYDVNNVGCGGEAKLTAVNIKGVLNGPVMCETLNTEKLLKNAYNAKRRQEYSSSNQNARVADEAEPKRNIKETAKEPVAKEPAAKETVVKSAPKVKEVKEKKPSTKKKN
jgi:cold shock CspA family protein